MVFAVTEELDSTMDIVTAAQNTSSLHERTLSSNFSAVSEAEQPKRCMTNFALNGGYQSDNHLACDTDGTNNELTWDIFVKKSLMLIRSLTAMEQRQGIRWMNPRALPKMAYIPTDIEHLANVTTHGICVMPAIFCALNLLWRSKSSTQLIVALVYGLSLALLFIVSTVFHCVFFCNRNRPLKDILHRCDRAMIYIFIAGSYFPWLSLSTPIDSHAWLFCLKWTIWLLAAFGILYQQMYHERYKCLETMLYIVMGVGPSLVIICCGHEFNGMNELKLGGLVYLIGILFFKADGSIPFAHAIWHIFVACASTMHYYAILDYLFPVQEEAMSLPVSNKQ